MDTTPNRKVDARFRRLGAKNGRAKLTPRRVRQIRALYARGGWNCRTLAERFGVGRQTIYNVVERVIWRSEAA